MNTPKTTFLMTMVALVAASGSALGSEPSAAPAQAPASPGQVLYTMKCAPCHGDKGDGQGLASHLQYPRPRNFIKGSYRLRSTPSGQLPTDEDLVRTITRGIAGTSMPAWRTELTAEQIRAVVDVVKAFNPRFKAGGPPKPIEIGAPPPATPETVAAGRKVYVRMQCSACHGDTGRGDGNASASMKDELGVSMRPYDFTQPGRMKGGESPEDVYRAFSTGLDGTPMPDFSGNLNAEERWQLVHYVQSLAKPSIAVDGAPRVIKAVRRASVPVDPLDPLWEGIAPTVVAVRPIWSRSDMPDRLAVSAVRSSTEIGLLLEWSDSSKNESALAVADFRDAVSVQFPVTVPIPLTPARPFIAMGDRSNPVNIWHWKADWQSDVTRHNSTKDRNPNMFVMTYHDMEDDPQFHTARAAGNLMAQRGRRSPIEDANAGGFGTLTAQSADSQQVDGRGVYGQGRWRVLIRRPLTTSDAGDVQFDRVTQVPVAFAVWDGGHRDRNGQKLFSSWETLAIEP